MGSFDYCSKSLELTVFPALLPKISQKSVIGGVDKSKKHLKSVGGTLTNFCPASIFIHKIKTPSSRALKKAIKHKLKKATKKVQRKWLQKIVQRALKQAKVKGKKNQLVQGLALAKKHVGTGTGWLVQHAPVPTCSRPKP